jgi:hypothetical protein
MLTSMVTQRGERPQVNSGRGRPEWDLSYDSGASAKAHDEELVVVGT